jgi:hypothetical protein
MHTDEIGVIYPCLSVSKILPLARLIGVIHDSNEALIAKSLPELIQNGRFTCADVAVNDSQPALIADGILTFGDAFTMGRGKIKEPWVRGGSEGVFFEIEIGSVHSGDSGGRVNNLDMTPESITAYRHTGCQDPKNHLPLALS